MKEEDKLLALTIGYNLRTLRQLSGFTQDDVGNHLGLTSQQVRNYEIGTNRISAVYIWKLACLFQCPVTYFFQDLANTENPASLYSNQQQRIATRIARAVLAIRSPTAQSSIIALIESLGGSVRK